MVTTQTNRDIELRWTAPFNNYESIDAFQVLVKTSTGTDSYEEERTHCAGDSAAIMAMSTPACLIPVAVLTAAPFSLSAGATVVARVLAHNARGWGLPSTPNDVGGIITTVPHQMAAPTRDDAGTSTVAIKVNWLPLNAPENGMSAIKSYNLKWDAGSSGTFWEDVVDEDNDYTLTYFTVTTGLTPGQSYRFAVRARNALGWGLLSVADPAAPSVKAATRPDKMLPVESSIYIRPPTATTLDPATGDVEVTFFKPVENAATIDSYKIEVEHQVLVDGAPTTTWSTTSACEGADSLVMAATACIIPMAKFLEAAPGGFGMAYDDPIKLRTSAHNAFGWSDVSDAAGDLKVRQKPTKMSTPQRDDHTTPTLLHVTWTPLVAAADIGSSPITSYDVEWDAGTEGGSWEHLQGYNAPSLELAIEITSGVTAGQEHRVRVSAWNVYGAGLSSDPLSIWAA